VKHFESFRDPGGKVVLTDTNVWRLVKPADAEQAGEFLNLQLAIDWQKSGKIVATKQVANGDREAAVADLNGHLSEQPDLAVFKHERIAFPSFPYEWSPQMLFDAGALTLELFDRLHRIGWGLKDASPFNVLFDGPCPVFIDLLSFERRDARDPMWLAFNQFVEAFVLPLLVNKKLSISLQRIFMANRDGLRVSEAAPLFGALRKLQPKVLFSVTLPNLLSAQANSTVSLYKSKPVSSPDQAQFILGRTLKRLRKQLASVSPAKSKNSDWTAYTEINRETLPDYMRTKETFVRQSIGELKPKKVLDVGCNTGFFTYMAADAGADVVAIDHDEAVIDRVYRYSKERQLRVLPLVLNLSRPTPSLGWRYSENPSFLDRAIGRFDLVMMLAVVHHMQVQERIPLREIFRLAADLTKDALIVEYVPPNDPMFRSLARGRDHLHADLTEESFVKAASEFFTIAGSSRLDQSERIAFLLRKK
jgi:SAM-dependent methyltransferase